AFNIAQYLSNPVEMALMIADNVRSELKNTSCVLLNGARLLLLGDKQQDWNLGACWYMRGLVALSEESPSARWIESSYGDVAAILQERPDFFEAYRTELMSAIGTAMDAKALTRKIGIRLAGVFEEFDVSQWFLQAPVNSGNSGDSA
ncbi:MAG: hypothetical protein HQL34_06795, partial [Alphaproteobacteria bacterium]|nr:hypothetical protein [Alphaproteobacteria bacterium]